MIPINSFAIQVPCINKSSEPRYIGYPPAPCSADYDNDYITIMRLDPEHRKALEASGWGIVATRQTPDGQEVQW